MSGILVDRVINKLGSVSEFVRQMQPEAIARHVSLHVADHVEEYVDGIMQAESPVLWANLPAVVKAQIYQHVRRSLPPMIDGLALALVAEVDQLVDVREMIASQLELDRGLMVRLFCEVGDAEFRFIINISFWDRPRFRRAADGAVLFPALAWDCCRCMPPRSASPPTGSRWRWCSGR